MLAAGLTGSPFAFEAHDDDPLWYGPTRHGMMVLALDPTHLGGHLDHIEQLYGRLEADGGRLPGSGRGEKRLSLRKCSGDTGDSDDDSDVEIEIEGALYEEILHITNGGDNWTQGYRRS